MLLPAFLRRERESAPGQALVEAALILPIVLLILMGILQFGLMLSANVGATNVAREVARYGSVCLVRDAASATQCGADTISYLNTVLPQRINAADPATDKTSICYESQPAAKAALSDPDRWNIQIIVKLGIRYPLFIPIIGGLIDGLDGEPGDGAFLLNAKEAMRVEGAPLAVNPGVLPCAS
jgi:Flp pilus assembly protein TadG